MLAEVGFIVGLVPLKKVCISITGVKRSLGSVFYFMIWSADSQTAPTLAYHCPEFD